MDVNDGMIFFIAADGEWNKLAPSSHPRWETIIEHDGRWLYFTFMNCEDAGERIIFVDDAEVKFSPYVFDTFADALHFKMKHQ